MTQLDPQKRSRSNQQNCCWSKIWQKDPHLVGNLNPTTQAILKKNMLLKWVDHETRKKKTGGVRNFQEQKIFETTR